MTLEAFRAKFPVVQRELAGEIARYKERKSIRSASPVALLARALREEAASGLQGIMRRFSSSGATPKIRNMRELRLSPEQRERLTNHYAGMLFGISVVALEETLVSCSFDARSFAESYNLAINGTPLAPMRTDEVYPLSEEQMRAMFACVEGDKTFCRFFKREGIDVMPPQLRDLLDSVGVLPFIQATIIPLFYERARFLVK